MPCFIFHSLPHPIFLYIILLLILTCFAHSFEDLNLNETITDSERLENDSNNKTLPGNRTSKFLEDYEDEEEVVTTSAKAIKITIKVPDEKSKEKELLNKLQTLKNEHRQLSDLIHRTHGKASDSRPRQVALNFLSEMMKSMESVFPRSIANIEREWICFKDNETSDTNHPSFFRNREKSSEFKFLDIASYDMADKLLEDVNNLLHHIQEKVTSLSN